MSELYLCYQRWQKQLKEWRDECRERRERRRAARKARRVARKARRIARCIKRRAWVKKNKPVRTILRHIFTLLTLGHDFPLIKWYYNRPRVRARIKRRREALRFFTCLIVSRTWVG